MENPIEHAISVKQQREITEARTIRPDRVYIALQVLNVSAITLPKSLTDAAIAVLCGALEADRG